MSKLLDSQDKNLSITNLGLSQTDIDDIVEKNVKLIEILKDKEIDKVSKIIKDGLANGESHDTIAKKISHSVDVAYSKAKFWAQDQSAKFFGAVQKKRQTDAGFPGYIWRTQKDRKVRPDHVARHGKYIEWETSTLNPGDDFRCRCFAEPAFEDDAPDHYQSVREFENQKFYDNFAVGEAEMEYRKWYAELQEETQDSYKKQRDKKAKKLLEKRKVKREDKKLKNDYSNWTQSQNIVTKNVLESYKHDSFLDINKSLRNSKGQDIDYQVKAIDKGMENAILKDDVETYRGIRDDSLIEQLFSLNEGDYFSDYGFGSTSISFDFAKKWAKNKLLLKIKVPKGKKAIYMPSVSNKLADEYELLLDRNTKFIVKKKYTDGNGIKYIELEVL